MMEEAKIYFIVFELGEMGHGKVPWLMMYHGKPILH
jgi:hypothetical protein